MLWIEFWFEHDETKSLERFDDSGHERERETELRMDLKVWNMSLVGQNGNETCKTRVACFVETVLTYK